MNLETERKNVVTFWHALGLVLGCLALLLTPTIWRVCKHEANICIARRLIDEDEFHQYKQRLPLAMLIDWILTKRVDPYTNKQLELLRGDVMHLLKHRRDKFAGLPDAYLLALGTDLDEICTRHAYLVSTLYRQLCENHRFRAHSLVWGLQSRAVLQFKNQRSKQVAELTGFRPHQLHEALCFALMASCFATGNSSRNTALLELRWELAAELDDPCLALQLGQGHWGLSKAQLRPLLYQLRVAHLLLKSAETLCAVEADLQPDDGLGLVPPPTAVLKALNLRQRELQDEASSQQ